MKPKDTGSGVQYLRPSEFATGRLAAGLAIFYWVFVLSTLVLGPGRCLVLQLEPYQCSMPLMMPALATAPTSAGLFALLDMIGATHQFLYLAAVVVAALIQGFVLWFMVRGPRQTSQPTATK